jgi:acetyl-CoA carboxylase carboxyl transferase alpha subunit
VSGSTKLSRASAAARSSGPPDREHPWSIVRYARQADRPGTLFYLESSFDDFRELHGDRRYRDDPSIRGGVAWVDGEPLVVLGHERGRSPEEQVRSNFGMPFPEGFEKARRLMRLAERFDLGLVTLVDTPGAYAGLGAEQRGQAGAIARLLECMAGLRVPIVSVIIGQGGSGGALALALADRVLMLEFAVYSVISPEGCASILWPGESWSAEAATALRLTARELRELRIVDEIIPEPPEGILQRPVVAAQAVRAAVRRHLRVLRGLPRGELLRRRAVKYARLGIFREDEESAL